MVLCLRFTGKVSCTIKYTEIQKVRTTWLTRICLFTAVVLIFSLTYSSEVQRGGYYILSDPVGSLLVTQSILDSGTIHLDEYRGSRVFPETDIKYFEANGHIFNKFPPGSSLMAIPPVLAANLTGRHMSVLVFETWMHCVLAAFTLCAFFLIILFAARGFLGFQAAFVVSLFMTLCSPAASTMGAAWWSTNSWVLFFSLAVLGVVRKWNGYLNGALLFGVFLSRPTGAIPVVLFAVYLIAARGHQTLRTLVSLVLMSIGFLIYSMSEFHTFLPPYYSPGGVLNYPSLKAFFLLLFSPSRGLFVFFPQGLLILAGVILYWNRIKSRLILILSLLSVFGLIILVSSHQHWWGGLSYGPRLLCETIPAWTIMAVLLWKAVPPGSKKTAAILFLVFSCWGFWVNTIQGLHNKETALWHDRPASVDQFPERLESWSSSQFLPR